jgi:hypothetical protein
MELISYGEFGRLRLREFCGDEVTESDYHECEWMGGWWYSDFVGFTWFGRLDDMPKETGGLEVSLSELPENVSSRILDTIHLPLRAGMTLDTITGILGGPFKTLTFVEDRKTYEFRVGSQHPYRVSCTVHDDKGLIFVSVIREDVLCRIEEAS